jgi:uncharacterized protein YcbX
MASEHPVVGSVVALWRYPVKSMHGEELNATPIDECGVRGDRAFALLDAVEERVASAKNPKKWPGLFDFRAAYVQPPQAESLPPLRLTLPDGRSLSANQEDRDRILSAVVRRPVTLAAAAPQAPQLEEYWPDIEGLPHRDAVTDEAMAAGTFFDAAAIHLLTTATLDRLRELYPAGRFEVRRFRPNIVVACEPAATEFVELGWVGRTVSLGDEVRLQVTGPCPRCVMTTLPQADLPRDPGILRTAVRESNGHVGVYARVLRGGVVRRGDGLRIDQA